MMGNTEDFRAYIGKLAPGHASVDVDLSTQCTFRIGGKAKYAFYPSGGEELVRDVRACRAAGIRYCVIGNGSNTLFADEGFDGAMIFTQKMTRVEIESRKIRAGAGVPLMRLAIKAQRASLGGLAFAYGIPGSVGGAVYMNAGAYEQDIGSVIEHVLIYDAESDETRILTAEECDFSYRHSVFQTRDFIVLGVSFSLIPQETEKIKAEMNDYMKRRREKQPLEYPSAGSVFKRYEGKFIAKMIDEAGLKGTRIGGAEISCKHAGFIVNRGGATAADVLALVELIRTTLREKEGVDPECEIRYIK